MTDKQPDALRLADELDNTPDIQMRARCVAAELRRLHQFAEDQIGRASAAEAALQMTKSTHAVKMAAVEAERDELLEVLKEMLSLWEEDPAYGHGIADRAYAVIAKVEKKNT